MTVMIRYLYIAAVTLAALAVPALAETSGPEPVITDRPEACIPARSVSTVNEINEDTLLFGQLECYLVRDGDNLLDIARINGVGYNEIVAANPGVDPWVPEEGKAVLIPTVWLIPYPLREGIVLNLAEMRLYYRFVMNGRRWVGTYPIGVGREGDDTPPGRYTITEKETNPTWYPPKSILLERPELEGPVPPGPDNPLGSYKMRLSYTSYLIHGTNKPLGIGRRVSHGCIRLYPEDIEQLYGLTPKGTPVEVVYKPVKAAVVSGRLYVEVHKDYREQTDMVEEAFDAIMAVGGLRLIDTDLLYNALQREMGIPTDITLRPKQASKTN